VKSVKKRELRRKTGVNGKNEQKMVKTEQKKFK
jgi:hypothetical protein